MGFEKNKKRQPKNRKTKTILVFDVKAREEFLTGFRKRKNERRKKAQDERKSQMKIDKKESKQRRRELLKKSMEYTGKRKKQNPEMDFKEFVKPEVIDLPEHTVTITDISDIDFAGHNGLRLGQNKESEQEIEEETEETEETTEDGNKKPLDKKGIKALYRKKSTEQHMRKVFGKHKVNYTHAQDKKFKMKRRTDFPNKKIKKRCH
ncbi:nucleolar protein 12-like [Mytilus galloprovincialis]|uniref:nucleolar protein 12-like n=1 Tax=Mytilus edulis TaxID=6550 RepID=UPI0039EE2B29